MKAFLLTDKKLELADKHLLGRQVDRKFDEYPATAAPIAAQPQ